MVPKKKTQLNREDWLRGTLKVLQYRGVDGVKIVVIAESLGVTSGSFYWHFKNLRDLLDYLLEFWEREMTDATARYNVSRPQYGEVNIVDIVRYYLVDEIIPAVAELGEVWIGQFYQELETVHDFTDQDWELIQSIHDMKPRPRGLDLEHIPVGRFLGRGVDILRTRSEKRKVLMLVTATADRESLKNLDEYRDMLRIADIDLYVVSFAPRATSPGSSSPARFNPYYFRKLVSETGGKFYLSGEYVFPGEFMNDLITTLSNSYTIGFYVHPGSPPSTRTVQLEVAREKIKVRHRKTLVF